jgi:hypothetical protein
MGASPAAAESWGARLALLSDAVVITVKLYTYTAGNLLAVIVPQSCGGTDCSIAQNLYEDISPFNAACLVLNFVTASVLALGYLVENFHDAWISENFTSERSGEATVGEHIAWKTQELGKQIAALEHKESISRAEGGGITPVEEAAAPPAVGEGGQPLCSLLSCCTPSAAQQAGGEGEHTALQRELISLRQLQATLGSLLGTLNRYNRAYFSLFAAGSALFLTNCACSGFLLFGLYFRDQRTTTTYVTNVLFVATPLWASLWQSWRSAYKGLVSVRVTKSLVMNAARCEGTGAAAAAPDALTGIRANLASATMRAIPATMRAISATMTRGSYSGSSRTASGSSRTASGSSAAKATVVLNPASLVGGGGSKDWH